MLDEKGVRGSSPSQVPRIPAVGRNEAPEEPCRVHWSDLFNAFVTSALSRAEKTWLSDDYGRCIG